MRGTTKISNNNSLFYLNKNYSTFMNISNKLAMEQQVVNLEDDPMAAANGLRLTNVIARSQQYNRNIKTGVGSLSLADGFLASCKTVMDKVNTLLTDAAQGATSTKETRAANAIEMNEILKQLVLSGNANDGERYIFGGQNTTTPPFTIVNGRYVNYTGNDKNVNILVDYMTTMAINVTGKAAFGNMTTTIPSRDMNPDVSLSTDRSTRLADLNAGQGVPKGKITVYYSAYPDGLEVDLSGCDTLEDVKDKIEKTTLDASRALDPAKHAWINPNNLDWHDLQDRYVKVTVNPEHNGISLQEFDLGEPLPQPTTYEQYKGLSYSGNPGYAGPGDLGIATAANVATKVCDKLNTVYGSGGYYAPLRVDDVAKNKVAEALGIKGSANKYDPARPDAVLDGFIHGRDLDPKLSGRTLLADLEGYNDSVYTFTNGSKPGAISIQETTQDSGNVFNEWNLTGLSKSKNTGPNGELYARAVNVGTPAAPDIRVEIYSCPIDKAKASDLVATGSYTASPTGGTVILHEANNSGVGGTVGIVLPQTVKEAKVSLAVDFGETLQASVHVPAFIEETNSDGSPRDVLNIASGWNIRGLDKPPAKGYDINHPASTDLDGDVSVNYRYDAATDSFIVELSRPAFNNQPATIIATGSLPLGAGNYGPPLGSDVSGRVEITGVPGFEGVKGSVYIELPANSTFAAAGTFTGTTAADATTLTYRLQDNAAAGTIVLGGAMELQASQTIPTGYFNLAGDTLFKKGQVFDQDVRFPNGTVIPAGTALGEDTIIPKGVQVSATSLEAGTVLAQGQQITFSGTGPVAGTVIPRGSYYTSGGGGFPVENMGISVTVKDAMTGTVTTTNSVPAGYDLRATFATIDDFNRAVEEAGIYVTSRVSENGKGIEFISNLAGAYLTVSEDTDCYEQMGDIYQQMTQLDLNGLVKGVNSDKNGNVYTEVIYYPPDPLNPGAKVQLISDSGDIVEVEPGYYVRVYSDAEQLQKTYENRDNTKMVAEGFVPSGTWNPAWDPTQPISAANMPFLPGNPPATLGTMNDLILEERNDSGVWGTVNLDYYGQRPPMTSTVVNGVTKYDYNPWKNDDITVFPGGLRPEGSRHTTIQQWDMYHVVPGVTCDYAGTYHGTITGDSTTAAGVDIKLYKDNSHSVMTARNDTSEALVDGRATLYEVDRYGNFALDASGNRIVAGTMVVAANNLLDGQTDDFKLTTGAARNYGQEREDNVFATINDIIDALNMNDEEALHNLLGNIKVDINRIVEARGDEGARVQRLKLLSDRHADDQVKYVSSRTAQIGMDDQALASAIMNYQASMNAYQAAMQVSGKIMQMSLLQYI